MIYEYIYIYMLGIERTKSNKKCKHIKPAIMDPGVFLTSETEELIQDNWHADLTGIQLDY